MDNICLTDEERQEIIKYGLERGKVDILFFGFVMFVGIVLDIVWQGLIFWLSFCSIRRYAGGYHADTQKKCSIISAVVVVLVFLCIKYWRVNHLIGILLQLSCYIVITILAPVDNKNRVLDSIERSKFRSNTIILSTIFCVFSLFLYWNKYMNVVIPIMMAYVVLAFSLIAGVGKRFFEKLKEKKTDIDTKKVLI